ncbi:HlyD family efflux transporter periplasmic adaptor subunit [Novosphingopyxis sp.]|uniref:HlyD family efflux transporter periplasmic adaptor subunit n=1 Tax=Novosphingopyxis sp. TaxID=2709690 RepID=UPI003B59CEB4
MSDAETQSKAPPKPGSDKPGSDQPSKPQGHDKQEHGNPDKQDDQEKKSKPPPARWPWVVGGLIVLVFVAVVLYEVFAPRPNVWTNDAYVRVHYARISPRVSGYVSEVLVNDTDVVRAGQLLVTLDPRDYQTAVSMAEAALERDTAQVVDAAANVARQPALITEQQAAVASAQASLAFTQANQRRYVNLAATGAGTGQQKQQADSAAEQGKASLQAAQAALEATKRQMQVLEAKKSSQDAVVKADQAQLEQARLNLSYTRIVAPIDGMIGQRSIQVGDNLAPGSTAMVVVPLDAVYIEANYRELDLRHVRNGQKATVHVDAYDIDLDGVVVGVAPASGAAFSPVPPINATGNFTKIVQRLPVKIALSPNQKLAKLLRVGFSVETTIHTGLENVVADQRDSANRVTAPR